MRHSNGSLMEENNSISTIIFDLGQVIVSFDHMELCRRASRHCAFSPDEVFERMFDSGLIKRFETGMITSDIFYSEACSALDMQLERGEFKILWNTIFALKPDTVQIIERLQEFQLLLLSNTNCWHFDYCLESYPVLRCFNDWILSYKVGACKPDKQIFEAALASASATAQECIFIDDISLYADAASAMGIHAHTFTTAEALEQFLSDMNII